MFLPGEQRDGIRETPTSDHDIALAAREWMYAGIAQQDLAHHSMRPCILFKAKLSKDGDMWCALVGDNLMEGISGFGKTPDEAMIDFDINWKKG
jgi:hypothetical protein